jgi:hypothetical protein
MMWGRKVRKKSFVVRYDKRKRVKLSSYLKAERAGGAEIFPSIKISRKERGEKVE